MMSSTLSSYADGLSVEAKSRYLDKIAVIGGIDPFRSSIFGEHRYDSPSVDACALLSYLVLQTSYITAEQFRAWKGLELYNQFVCGWEKEVITCKIAGKFIAIGRVSRNNANCYISQMIFTLFSGASLTAVE